MIRPIWFFVLAVSLLALPAHAAEIAMTDTLTLDINLSAGWTLHLQPPEALVKEAASHVAHEAAAANATAEQIEKVARKRMTANEAFIYHAGSGAHLDIDFSPLEQGESAPSTQTLRNSAEYAAQSLEGEADVADMVWKVTSAKVNGADETFLLSANYLQHDRLMSFLGYIGYVGEHWFFLYFTVPGKDSEALQEMQSMLEHAVIRSNER
ncbi:MAG: hypothetical protein KAU27_07015 [Desulfuromonadales bacterium]|nr:hypothetical protein [Desulfuromonadales bacterium]